MAALKDGDSNVAIRRRCQWGAIVVLVLLKGIEVCISGGGDGGFLLAFGLGLLLGFGG